MPREVLGMEKTDSTLITEEGTDPTGTQTTWATGLVTQPTKDRDREVIDPGPSIDLKTRLPIRSKLSRHTRPRLTSLNLNLSPHNQWQDNRLRLLTLTQGSRTSSNLSQELWETTGFRSFRKEST